jgi:hypothetical protein
VLIYEEGKLKDVGKLDTPCRGCMLGPANFMHAAD